MTVPCVGLTGTGYWAEPAAPNLRAVLAPVDLVWAQVREQESADKAHRAEAAAGQSTFDIPAAPMVAVVLPAPRPASVVVPSPEPEFADVDDDQELVLEGHAREQVLDRRNP
ncbi:hypothetical protein Sros01_67860 [Streptomyces roseochromogenus]|nr:hypothetical protein Sros01_67860 [Streptomyces roseochromogenus]